MMRENDFWGLKLYIYNGVYSRIFYQYTIQSMYIILYYTTWMNTKLFVRGRDGG